jgi:pyridoxine 4-dehydrogenase
LTGSIKKSEDIPAHSFMRYLPKYQVDVLDKNLKLVEEVRTLSLRKNCTMAQLALAWVKYLSEKPGMPLIIPIPGASTQEHVSENLRDIQLTDMETEEIDNILALHAVRGQRYGGAGEHLSEL